jgi:hypothetical protein
MLHVLLLYLLITYLLPVIVKKLQPIFAVLQPTTSTEI